MRRIEFLILICSVKLCENKESDKDSETTSSSEPLRESFEALYHDHGHFHIQTTGTEAKNENITKLEKKGEKVKKKMLNLEEMAMDDNESKEWEAEEFIMEIRDKKGSIKKSFKLIPIGHSAFHTFGKFRSRNEGR